MPSSCPCRLPLPVVVVQQPGQSVRPLAERLYDIRHWSEFERGGHFAAMEVPELLAEDIRDFFLTRLEDDSPRRTRLSKKYFGPDVVLAGGRSTQG